MEDDAVVQDGETMLHVWEGCHIFADGSCLGSRLCFRAALRSSTQAVEFASGQLPMPQKAKCPARGEVEVQADDLLSYLSHMGRPRHLQARAQALLRVLELFWISGKCGCSLERPEGAGVQSLAGRWATTPGSTISACLADASCHGLVLRGERRSLSCIVLYKWFAEATVTAETL